MKNHVAHERQRRGWSQAVLGERAGVSRQTIISIERGRFDPSLPLAFRLAKILECRIEDLFVPERND